MTLRQAPRELVQVRGKSFDVMKILVRVFEQVGTGQLAGGPGLIKRMAKQVILRDARIQLLKKFWGCHFASRCIESIVRGTQVGWQEGAWLRVERCRSHAEAIPSDVARGMLGRADLGSDGK